MKYKKIYLKNKNIILYYILIYHFNFYLKFCLKWLINNFILKFNYLKNDFKFYVKLNIEI
jgi:hypothetical protein